MEVDVLIIGTGFGASVAVTKLLEKKPYGRIDHSWALWC